MNQEQLMQGLGVSSANDIDQAIPQGIEARKVLTPEEAARAVHKAADAVPIEAVFALAAKMRNGEQVRMPRYVIVGKRTLDVTKPAEAALVARLCKHVEQRRNLANPTNRFERRRAAKLGLIKQ